MTRGRRSSLAWSIAAVTLACGGVSLDDLDTDTDAALGPAPAPDLRSTYFDVFLGPDARLCGPTLERLDDEVVRLAAALGVLADPDDRIVLHYGAAAVEAHCGAHPDGHERFGGGCAEEDGGWIAAQPGLESHALVHALRRRATLSGPPYWEEGLATYLGTARPYAPLLVRAEGQRRPSLSLRAVEPPRHVDRLEAAHFIAYLDEIYGADHVRWLALRLGEQTEPGAAFEHVLGVSLEHVEERWLDEAERTYELGPQCDEHLMVGAEPVVIRGEIGCDVPGVLGPGMETDREVFRGPRHCFETRPDTVLTVTVRGADAHGVAEVRSVRTEVDCTAREPNLGADVPPGRTRALATEGCLWSVVYASSLEGDAYAIELSVE